MEDSCQTRSLFSVRPLSICKALKGAWLDCYGILNIGMYFPLEEKEHASRKQMARRVFFS